MLLSLLLLLLCRRALLCHVLLQFLCCELSALQQQGKLQPLKLYDIAAASWRLRVVAELQGRITEHEQVGRLHQHPIMASNTPTCSCIAQRKVFVRLTTPR